MTAASRLLSANSAGRTPQPFELFRIVREATEVLRDRARVAGLDQETGLAVMDERRQPSDARGDHRHAKGERLEHDDRATVECRRENEHVERRQVGANVVDDAEKAE